MRLLVVIILSLMTVADSLKSKKSKVSNKRQVNCNDPNLYLCSNGQCIQEEWLCDTENDCGTNEDEIGCPTDCSGPHQFHCNNGRCITIEYRCDGDDDCLDRSDEQGCSTWPCPAGETKCPNTYLCIENVWLCDGHNNCHDNWDEQPANCHGASSG